MATTQGIITKALRRIRVVGILQDPPAEMSKHALDALNAQLSSWSAEGLSTDNQSMVGNYQTGSKTITGLSNSANQVGTAMLSPRMHVSGTGIASGTRIFSVDSADQITLDTAATASGSLASLNFTILPLDDNLEAALVAVLAVRLAPDFGAQVDPVLARDANRGEYQIQGAFFKLPRSSFDTALTHTASRRLYDGTWDGNA